MGLEISYYGLLFIIFIFGAIGFAGGQYIPSPYIVLSPQVEGIVGSEILFIAFMTACSTRKPENDALEQIP